MGSSLNYTGECGERYSRKTTREKAYRKSYEKTHSLRSLVISQLETKKSKTSASFRKGKRSNSTDGCMYPVTTEIAVNLQQPVAMFDGHYFSSGTGSGVPAHVPAHVPEVCSGTGRCSTAVSFRARGKHAMLSPVHPVCSDTLPVFVPLWRFLCRMHVVTLANTPPQDRRTQPDTVYLRYRIGYHVRVTQEAS